MTAARAERESGAAVAGGPEHAAVARGEEDEDRGAVVDGGRPARPVQRTAARAKRERERGAAVAGDPEHAAGARGEEDEDCYAVVGVGRQARVVKRTAAGERSAAVGAGRLVMPVRSRFC